MTSKSRGKLIVLEGLDKAGKSTQCAKLVKNLETKGHKVRHMRFPDRTTPIGQMINSYLQGTSSQEDHVIHLLFSANRWEAASSIRSDIEAGTNVVIDRYYYSGVVYSAAKDNPKLTLEWARQPDVGLPCPDLCIFLNISEEEAAKRGGFGEEKYESRQMQRRVREMFGKLKELDPMATIDASGSQEEVEQKILDVAMAVFSMVGDDEPLRTVEPL